MKIAYFSYLFDIKGTSAGSANKAIGFMEGFRQLGHETEIFWRGDQPDAMEQESIKLKTRSFLKKKMSNYLHEPKMLFNNARHLVEENRILRQANPDILISRLEQYAFSARHVCKKRNIPFVIEADCPPIYENNTFYGKDYYHLNFIAEKIEHQNLIKADAIIVLSNILKDYFMTKNIPEEKMFVIPNGADPDVFCPGPKDDKLNAQYSLKGKTVVGWIGSLEGDWAGLGNLISMTKKVLTERKDVAFLFVGGGTNKARFQDAFNNNGFLDRIVLPGTVPYEEVPKYLSLMDIVIAPYPKLDFWYPSSMKIFEYMSGGKAVIASGVGQINEVITDGVDGCLYDPDLKDELTNTVLNLIAKPEFRKSLSKNARQTVLEKYTWKKHAETMENILKGVLERRK